MTAQPASSNALCSRSPPGMMWYDSVTCAMSPGPTPIAAIDSAKTAVPPFSDSSRGM